MKGKSRTDFRAAHDPTFRVDNPAPIYSRKLPKGTDRFIITCAQNATPVHAGFWNTLQQMAQLLGAQVLVVPIRYKNPTSTWAGSQENAEYWDANVQPFLWNQRAVLGPNVEVLGDIKIQPTAVTPLVGAEALSLSRSGIVAHPKIQLRSVATPSSRMAKLLMTTGACTVANYSDTRAGKLGEFHHSLAAVLVEIAPRGRFHARHLHWDHATRSVTDLNVTFDATGAKVAAPPLALIMGDTHVDFICPGVRDATFGKGGMVELLKPKYLLWHDLLDSYSVNPHHLGNPFNVIAKHRGDRGDVRAEVDRAIDFVRTATPEGCKSVIVGSNHDDMLRRYIIRGDWKNDPVNADFYLETALAMVRSTRMGKGGAEYGDPFRYWVSRHALPRVIALEGDESFALGGVELGMHGDRGPNGARGSVRNLRRIGVKSIIGHSHTPGIEEGCYQVGTSTRLRLEYNHGASSWLNAHCILHANRKRQLVVIVDGEYRHVRSTAR